MRLFVGRLILVSGVGDNNLTDSCFLVAVNAKKKNSERYAVDASSLLGGDIWDTGASVQVHA